MVPRLDYVEANENIPIEGYARPLPYFTTVPTVWK
jgi:hypothetical protein